MRIVICSLVFVGLLGLSSVAESQTRDEMVHNDRQQHGNNDAWFYDDLESGFEAATQTGKPLMVVLRCIP